VIQRGTLYSVGGGREACYKTGLSNKSGGVALRAINIISCGFLRRQLTAPQE